MAIKKSLLALTLLAVSAPSMAFLGLSVGANAGAARLSGSGSNQYGYEYGINASYSVAPFISISSGYTSGEGKVETDFTTGKQTVKYTSIPVQARIDIPLIIGDIYAKAGANYYDVDHFNTNDSGWGMTAGAGVAFTMIPFIDLAVGYEYREMGKLTTDSVVFSAGLSF
ncbi:outer membrane beta-barrel protein [Thaumasiovibrio sp. DFM-14]|uniref:outer membrane beta-barrel protein n=1 Tax=Thaumasiovibrio sp. DFM-14 TaxID=3384792 RepID=UPI0039A196CA